MTRLELSSATCRRAGDHPGRPSGRLPVVRRKRPAELESEEITESWDQYVQADLTSEINGDLFPEIADLWDGMTGDDQRTMFWSVVSDLDIYPEHDGLDIRWTQHYAAIVEAIDTKLAAL